MLLAALLSLPVIPADALPPARTGMTTLVFTSAGELRGISTSGGYRVFPVDAAFIVDILPVGTGTYVKPSGATALSILAVGGGGGGSSAYQHTQESTLAGGAGGNPGWRNYDTIPASFLAANAPYRVGAGGAGGLSPAAGVPSANVAGTDGDDTVLGATAHSMTNTAICARAQGGNAIGANAYTGPGGTLQYMSTGGDGYPAATSGTVGLDYACAGGGGGGAVSAVATPPGVAGPGGNSGWVYANYVTPGAQSAGGAAGGGDGAPGTDMIGGQWIGGGGGGGGALVGVAGRGGHGGRGGFPGGGGGGGGSHGLAGGGAKAGNGGRGGDGVLIVMARR